MFKSVPVFIGLRYVRAKRRNHFISIISVISIIGITLGVATLIIVLSVMNGFAHEIKDRLLGMESHLTVQTSADWKTVIKDVKGNKSVTGAAPYIQGGGLINYRNVSQGVRVHGVNPDLEPEVSQIQDRMYYGRLADLKKTKFGIILGYEVATKLLGTGRVQQLQFLQYRSAMKHVPGASALELLQVLGLEERITDGEFKTRVTLIIPKVNYSAIGPIIRSKIFELVGIFQIEMQQYDSTMVVLNIDDAAKLYKTKKQVTGIQVKLTDMFKASEIATQLIAQGGKQSRYYQITPWMQRHRNVFAALKTEKRMMFLVLLIIVIVAAINVISTLVMVVTDKQSDIAILRTLGAAPNVIRNIFIVQGLVIGVIGVLTGLALGVLVTVNVESIVSFLETLFGIKFLSGDVFYISKIVGVIHWDEVSIVCSSTLIITLLATLYPAHAAANTQPAEALRYE